MHELSMDGVSAGWLFQPLKEKDGWTALNFVAYYGNTSLVKLLVENHADVNISNKAGRTPLSFATQCKNSEVEVLLQAHGAEPSGKL